VSLSITFANSLTRGNSFNLLSLAAIVMFGNIFSCRIVDVWNSLSDAVVKSSGRLALCLFYIKHSNSQVTRFYRATLC